MINYSDGYCAVHTLFRVNGSAAYKSLVYSILSTVLYVASFDTYSVYVHLSNEQSLSHPYVISALLSAFMLLLSTKVTFSYNRFWEACAALHSMQSKWLDTAQILAAFHLQSAAYASIRPTAFGEHSDINDMLLDRERKEQLRMSTVSMDERIEQIKSNISSSKNKVDGLSFGKFLTKEFKLNCKKVNRHQVQSINQPKGHRRKTSRTILSYSYGGLPGERLTTVGDEEKELLPSLFLQESAHLISLMSAVAFSTLRNEIEGVEAPLCEFIPGKPWPNYNSNDDPTMKEYGYNRHWVIRNIRYILDISRTPQERAAYNMSRPFPVIGGVSEREAKLLQQARGAPAKVSLVNLWFNEFVVREHLYGSTGNVGPPIISRVQQFQSDGFMWWNSARKLSYIPFPFPHSQITTIFVLLTIFMIPVLMLSFASFWLGVFFNFFTVALFAGLNEVSKELEYPYRCMPNDLPLNLFQAQTNEALLTTFAGYHPDSYWEVMGDTNS